MTRKLVALHLILFSGAVTLVQGLVAVAFLLPILGLAHLASVQVVDSAVFPSWLVGMLMGAYVAAWGAPHLFPTMAGRRTLRLALLIAVASVASIQAWTTYGPPDPFPEVARYNGN